MSKLDEIIVRIREERQRQFDLPGAEWDSQNSPGEWVALIGHYVNDEVRHKGITPSKVNFEDSLVKAAAIIIAALEHTDKMQERGQVE